MSFSSIHSFNLKASFNHFVSRLSMKIESKDVASLFYFFWELRIYFLGLVVHHHPGLSTFPHRISVAYLEKVAIVESWLGRYCWRLQVLVVVDGRMIEVSMIVKIRQRLLKVNACLLLRFVILAQRLHIRMMIDFDWLSYLWLVLPSAHATLHANHVTCLQRRITPETWHQQWE